MAPRKPAKPPEPRTAREHIAAMTNTRPEDWAEILRGTRMYARGYRYFNAQTGEYAKKNIT